MTLKDLRIKSGFKQNKIIEQLGLSRSGLYFIEIGKSKPDKLKVEKLAQIYDCSEEEILNAWREKNEQTNTK
jgi:transcriptional regulator with XRE-family HTH domain